MSYRRLEIADFFTAPPPFTVRFDGTDYLARPNEGLAYTLLANGVYVLGRSSKYHRPRGMFCGRGTCSHCLAQLNEQPNRRLCRSLAQDGTQASAQNTWGKARLDLLGAIDYAFPGGLDHHHFMTGSSIVNRICNAVVRQLGGLGRLPSRASQVVGLDPVCLDAEVSIVGAGAAGRAALAKAQDMGLRTVVLESRPGAQPAVLHNTTVLGRYDAKWLVAVREERLYLVSSPAVVLATGTNEIPPSCPGNDLPGILARRAVENALELGILPGKRPVVALDPAADATIAKRATALVEALEAAGAPVVATLGMQPRREQTPATQAGLLALGSIEGRCSVRRVRTTRGDESFSCDSVVCCGRSFPAYQLPQQMGVPVLFERDRGAFVPQCDSRGETACEGIFLAGEVAGRQAEAAPEHGTQVMQTVAEWLAQSNRSLEKGA